MKNKYAVLFLVMTLLFFVTASLLFHARREQKENENTLKGLYESAMLTTFKHLNDMQYDIRKAQINQDSGENILLLTSLSADAAGIRHSLSLLPGDSSQMAPAFKFMNQVSDYTKNLAACSGEGLTKEQMKIMDQLLFTCEKLLQYLTEGKEEEPFPAIEKADIEYPSLLYDGPFSDSTVMKAVSHQDWADISMAEALERARVFTGIENCREAVNTGGPIPCFGVTAEKEGEKYQLGITRRGGKVLWMFPETAHYDMKLSLEECRERGKTFLKNHGYPDMVPLYFQIYDGLAVINFAPEEEGILFYPDQVKLQIRMDTGETAGIESRGYYMHHRKRLPEEVTPLITQEEGKSFLSSHVYPTRPGRLCVIPKDGEECLCYEFSVTYAGERYLIYLNARTSHQESILKIVENPHGLTTF